MGASHRVLSWLHEGVRVPWNEHGPPHPFHHGVASFTPSITPSQGVYALLGWLVDGDYSSGPTERVRLDGARARADMGKP